MSRCRTPGRVLDDPAAEAGHGDELMVGQVEKAAGPAPTAKKDVRIEPRTTCKRSTRQVICFGFRSTYKRNCGKMPVVILSTEDGR